MVNVLVTGATGRTGSLVLKQLRDIKSPNKIDAAGFARNQEKVQQMFGDTHGFYFGNITNPESLKVAMANQDALIILTSAIPQVTPPTEPGKPPGCTFELGGTPEEVDYQGQINQINSAKAAGVKHIILVGSMGGTNKHHPLNSFGQILIWKRKAEKYLINSGIDYTIIRAGGLIDEPGGRELLVGKNDELLIHPPNGIATTIPRVDVAQVAIQALIHPEARNKAFDVIATPAQHPTDQDFASLFAQTTHGLSK